MPSGGKRKGAGRKPDFGVTKIQKTIRIPQHWIDILERDFGGVQSGVQTLIIKYLEDHPQQSQS